MPNSRITSLRRAVLTSLTSTALLPQIGWSQGAQGLDDDPITIHSDVVVTGTRVANRSRLETLAPVDVLPSTALTEQGSTELGAALSTVAPSFDFPRPAISDGTDHVRPATLRGLAPDQTLVLVNSKRRHASALVNVNGSIGRGAAAADLNAIPLAAIDRIEVLRDGASAQYGSDAIAGVVNIHLREAREGAATSLTYGEYVTTVDTARAAARDVTDGRTLTASGWVGLTLGTQGFLTLSAEYRDRDPTSRGDLDPRVTPPLINSRYGDPESRDRTLYVNAGVPMSDTWDIYAWAGYQNRDANSAATPRIAGNANNTAAGTIAPIYPSGFLPFITSDIDDLAAAWGTRFDAGEWQADVSVVYGRNAFDFGVINTLNGTYGAASPRSFDAGGLRYSQWVFDAGLVREFDFGFVQPLNLAWGVEARRENYQIKAGEPRSWNAGPVTGTGITPGAQGFPGFQPSNEVDESRTNYGAYLDVESQFTEKFLGSLAGRYEHYSDFGSSATGKLSVRYDFVHAFALRGTVSTGFRAPSLQQEFFTSTATNFINGNPFEVGTFPASSPVARALGASDLDAEKSNNYSLGAVFRSGDFEATVDAYQIDVRDRIVLSENLNTPTARADITAILSPYNVGAARFFLNGVKTQTRGVDVVMRYELGTGAAGNFDFTVAGNYNQTKVKQLPTTGVLSALSPPPELFARVNTVSFEKGTPRDKIVLATGWKHPASFGTWGASVKATRYGDTTEPGTTAANDIPIDATWLVDLEARLDLLDHYGIAIGVDNAFDQYPAATAPNLNSNGPLGYSRYSPFGFNGRYVYARVSWRM